jgi:hypothetical protein
MEMPGLRDAQRLVSTGPRAQVSSVRPLFSTALDPARILRAGEDNEGPWLAFPLVRGRFVLVGDTAIEVAGRRSAFGTARQSHDSASGRSAAAGTGVYRAAPRALREAKEP